MPDTPTPGPLTDPYEAIERAQEQNIAHPEQPPMDDAASGLPDDDHDAMTDNSVAR